jgi:D-sedoheptulose 7-phosphate isomerase
MQMDLNNVIKEHHDLVKKTFDSSFLNKIQKVGDQISRKFRQNGKVILFGNGGSAADAQHISAEFVSKLSNDRPALPSLALTVDTSAITAIGNDYGYDEVFARQISALCTPKDLAIGISTSGKSENVIRGLRAAKGLGAFCVGLTGQNGLADYEPDICLSVPSLNTARIQEMHIIIGHMICGIAETDYV